MATEQDWEDVVVALIKDRNRWENMTRRLVNTERQHMCRYLSSLSCPHCALVRIARYHIDQTDQDTLRRMEHVP